MHKRMVREFALVHAPARIYNGGVYNTRDEDNGRIVHQGIYRESEVDARGRGALRRNYRDIKRERARKWYVKLEKEK